MSKELTAEQEEQYVALAQGLWVVYVDINERRDEIISKLNDLDREATALRDLSDYYNTARIAGIDPLVAKLSYKGGEQ